MAVRVTSRLKQWTDKTERKLDEAVLEMATDIHRVSGMLAPKDTRALVNSGRIVRNGVANYSIIYGGGSVPYARIQHDGGTIKPKNKPFLAWEKDGEWHFAKKVTIKGNKYLELGGDSVSRNVKRYLRGI